MVKIQHVLFLFLCAIGVQALGSAKRLQICADKCQSDLCKTIAKEIEFKLELSKEYLIPPCKKSLAALRSNEYRVKVSDELASVTIELSCEALRSCLSKSYKDNKKAHVLVAQIVRDMERAIKNPPKPVLAQSVEKKSNPQKPVEIPSPIEDQWDRVILTTPSEPKDNSPPPLIVNEQAERAPSLGSVTASFGAESWNYIFTATNAPERILPINSRIYPRVALSASYWPLSILRMSANMSGSLLNLRLRANQPVEGDGQLIRTQVYDADFIVGLLKPFANLIHFGVDAGYEFRAALVDEQRLADRAVIVVPSYQSHALRIGPRIVIGAMSDKGVIDVGVGFYPFVYYTESPDEPTSTKRLFAWSVHGLVRLMLGSEMFADASVKAHAFHVDYSMEPNRESVDGDKWGPGTVTNTSASTALGLGWLF